MEQQPTEYPSVPEASIPQLSRRGETSFSFADSARHPHRVEESILTAKTTVGSLPYLETTPHDRGRG